jgi:chromosome segregation ATPase
MSHDAYVLFPTDQIEMRVNLEKEQNMTDKDAYVQKLHAKLDEWNVEIEKLKAKADKAEADSRAEYHKQVEDLREKRKDAESKIRDVVEAGDGALEDLGPVSKALGIQWKRP